MSEVWPKRAVLPVFPLAGVVLLPGARLPLHIFEPRYRNLVRDVIAGDRVMGMIQPYEPPANGAGDGGRAPALYSVGCAGKLEQWQRLPDGRYVLILEGLSRFRTGREVAGKNGYRRLEVDYDAYSDDRDQAREEVLDPSCFDQLLARLRVLAARHDVEIEVERLERLSPDMLVTTMTMGLPFAPAEKQALLEAPTAGDRYRTLISLLDMGVDLGGRPDAGRHQTH